jgi:hypothetical protein
MPTTVTAEDIARNPAWHLYDVDLERGELHFLEATVDTFRVSAFLDNRIAFTRGELHGFPLDAVAAALRNQPPASAATHFLLHSSFCCSSLLARSLQLDGRTLVLREPWALRRLSDFRRGLATRGQAWYPHGPGYVDLVLRLLGKSWLPSEAVLIKPTNLANNLAADMLKLRPEARALLLHSDLPSFLVSNLKKPDETKQKMPLLARLFDQDTGYADRVGGVSIEGLDYLRSVAVVWHAQMLAFRDLLSSDAGPRLAHLDSAQLLEKPADTLEAAARFYGLWLPAGEARDIAAGPVWHTHAKDPFSAYDSVTRDAENRDIAARHGDAMRDTLGWMEGLLARQPAELPPARALMSVS